jgi:hypothetical protein
MMTRMEPLRLSSPPPYFDYLREPTWPTAVDVCRAFLASLPDPESNDGQYEHVARYLRWLTTEVEALLDELRRRGLPIDDPSSAAATPTSRRRPSRGPEDYTAFVVWIDNDEVRNRRPELAADIPDPSHYAISLQASSDVDPPYFDGPDMADLDDALHWARTRASRVLVRPRWDPGRHYIADNGPATDWKLFD